MALSVLLACFLFCFAETSGLIIPNINSNGDVDFMGMVLNLTAEMKIAQTKIDNLEAEVKTLREHDGNTSTQLQSMKERSGKRVLFTARVAQDPLGIPGNLFTIKFAEVITNIGGGYNPNTGVFHTPVAGDYLFVLQILGVPNEEVDLQIKANGNVAATLYVDAGTVHDMSSVSALLHLDEGEEVNVEKGWSYGCTQCSIRGKPWSQFAGMLLRAD